MQEFFQKRKINYCKIAENEKLRQENDELGKNINNLKKFLSPHHKHKHKLIYLDLKILFFQ